jgi:hypothetical protein
VRRVLEIWLLVSDDGEYNDQFIYTISTGPVLQRQCSVDRPWCC